MKFFKTKNNKNKCTHPSLKNVTVPPDRTECVCVKCGFVLGASGTGAGSSEPKYYSSEDISGNLKIALYKDDGPGGGGGKGEPFFGGGGGGPGKPAGWGGSINTRSGLPIHLRTDLEKLMGEILYELKEINNKLKE